MREIYFLTATDIAGQTALPRSDQKAPIPLQKRQR